MSFFHPYYRTPMMSFGGFDPFFNDFDEVNVWPSFPSQRIIQQKQRQRPRQQQQQQQQTKKTIGESKENEEKRVSSPVEEKDKDKQVSTTNSNNDNSLSLSLSNFWNDPFGSLTTTHPMESISFHLNEDDSNYTVNAVIPPSMSKDDIQLKFHDGLLSVTAEKQEEKSDGDGNHYQKSSSYMERSIRLPEGADENQIKAKWEAEKNSLVVTIKKVEKEKKEKKGNIQIE